MGFGTDEEQFVANGLQGVCWLGGVGLAGRAITEEPCHADADSYAGEVRVQVEHASRCSSRCALEC